jgi:hypothetical protein
MARVEPEALTEPERIYIAGTLRMALRIEEWLTMAGVDYAVQVEPYGRSLLFNSLRMGAAFYVRSAQATYCREQLTAAGFGRGVVESQE